MDGAEVEFARAQDDSEGSSSWVVPNEKTLLPPWIDSGGQQAAPVLGVEVDDSGGTWMDCCPLDTVHSRYIQIATIHVLIHVEPHRCR